LEVQPADEGLAPITSLLAGYFYGIIVSRRKDILSWGVQLENTVLPSFFAPVLYSATSLFQGGEIMQVCGSETAVAALVSSSQGQGQIWVLRFSAKRSGEKQTFETVNGVFADVNIQQISVGAVFSAAADDSGRKTHPFSTVFSVCEHACC
jgi:hypothetical protein